MSEVHVMRGGLVSFMWADLPAAVATNTSKHGKFCVGVSLVLLFFVLDVLRKSEEKG